MLFHLVKGAKFELKELATSRFVGMGVSPRRMRRQVTRWPLLIVRMLAVAALALLGARPFFSEARPVVPLREVIVAVDTSGSMARRGPAAAEKALREVKADLPSGTPLRVVGFSDVVRAQEDGSLTAAVPGAATSYDRLVQWGMDQAPTEGAVRLVVISDFTRPALDGLRPRVWPAGADVRLMPVGPRGAWNAGIARVNCLTPVAAEEVEIEAELAFYGLTPSEPFVLTLKSEGGTQREETVPAGSPRVRFRWPLRIPAAGLALRGELTLRPQSGDPDEITWDDHQAFAFPVVRQRRVLLVEGDSGGTVFAGECYFADKALRAGLGDSGSARKVSGAGGGGGTSGMRSPFEPTMRPSLGDLSGFHAVVLANVAELSSVDAQRLAGFVQTGGGLLVTAGDRFSPALTASLRSAGIDIGTIERTDQGQKPSLGQDPKLARSPGENGGERGNGDPDAAVPVHPASSPGNPLSTPATSWNGVSFAGGWRLNPPEKSLPWLENDAGQPLLATLPETGKGGRILVLAQPLDADGNNFPRHPLYVVLMREMMAYLTHYQASAREFPAVATGSGEPRAPGVYPDARAGWIQVRADEAESDIVSEPLNKIRAAFGLPETSGLNQSPTTPVSAAAPLTRQRPSEWWPWLAGLLFVLFSLESILAGRRSHILGGSGAGFDPSASGASGVSPQLPAAPLRRIFLLTPSAAERRQHHIPPRKNLNPSPLMLIQKLETMAGFRRRRLLRHSLVRAGGVLLLLLIPAALADVVLGIPLVARWVILAVGVGLTLWEFQRSGGWRALRTDAAEAARLCEAANPESGQALRTALELAGGKHAASPPLAQALMGRAFEQISRLDQSRLLTPAGWKKTALGAGAAAAVGIVLVSAWPDFCSAALRSLGFDQGFSHVALTASNAAAPRQPLRVEAAIGGRSTDSAVLHWRTVGDAEWRAESMSVVAARRFDSVITAGETELECYAVSGDSTSPVLRIPVRIPAKASVAKVVITPPAYLGEAPREQDKGDIDAPEDSTAEITLTFNQPVSTARIMSVKGGVVALTMSPDSRQGTAKLTVAAGSLTWHAAAQDGDGKPVESDTWQLTGRADSLPDIRLLEPGDETSATAIWELPARLRARDDHGLARVGITLRAAGQEKPLFEKEFDTADTREAAGMATLALDTMALGITDNIQVFAWATDRKPRPNNARAVTPIANIDIRQFQIRKLDAPPCECAGECLNLVEKMISAQRHVLSDSFQLKETTTWREVSLTDTEPLSGREMEITADGEKLLEKMADAATSGFNLDKDRDLATDARNHTNEAVAGLQTVDLISACDHEDKALTNLLQLRREIMKKMSKGGKSAKPKKKDGDLPPSLGDLARRLDKAAAEEKDVADQAASLTGGAACPEPLRSQQQATMTELGDIAGELDRHQNLTTFVRERMDRSEAAASAAGDQLTVQPKTAVVPLQTAEAQIRELAEHLRLLENQASEQSLARMEKNAREAAKALEACAVCNGSCQSHGGGKSQGDGAAPPSPNAPDADAATAAIQPVPDSRQKSGTASESASAPGESPDKMSADKARQLAERTATTSDVLSAGLKPGGSTATNNTSATVSQPGETQLPPESLPDPAQTQALSEGMEAWAKAVKTKAASPQAESADAALAGQARDLAARQQQLADSLTQSLASIRQAQVEKLQALRRETQSRHQKARSRELTAQGAPSNQTGNPGSPAGSGATPGAEGEAHSNSGSNTADADNSSSNTGTPDGRNPVNSPALSDADYQKRLAATGDTELKNVLQYLAQTQTPASGAFDFIDQRLTALLAQFSRTAFATRQKTTVPPAWRHTVDDYFRALSDDLGDDDTK